MGEDRSCLGVGSFKHILSGCKTSLIQSRYTWRHNKVSFTFHVKSFAYLFENKEVEVNSLPVEKAHINNTGKWKRRGIGDCLLMSEDNFKFHSEL